MVFNTSIELRKLICERCPLQCSPYQNSDEYPYSPSNGHKIPIDFRYKPETLHQTCRNYNPIEKMKLELML